MAKKKLRLTVTNEIEIPAGIKIIRNDQWVTLAKKKGNVVEVFTMESQDVRLDDILDENSWLDFSKEELKKLAAL